MSKVKGLLNKTSDKLYIGIDMGDREDDACMVITRKKGNDLEVVNTIYGKEAEDLYDMLTIESPLLRKAIRYIKEE